MRCFLLQDFITIRGASTITTVTQSESQWLDLEPYQDVVLWLDVREISPAPGGGTNVQMTYETSATRDEFLFVPVSGPTTLSSLAVTVTPLFMASVTNPLGRFLRWKLTMAGTAAAWDIMFRIWVAANSPGPWRGRSMISAPAPPQQANQSPPSVPLHMTDGSTTAFTGLGRNASGGPMPSVGQRYLNLQKSPDPTKPAG